MAAPALQWDFPERYIEKRQLFLRSYQFSRKRGAAERLRSSTVRVRRLICFRLICLRLRLRDASRLPHLLWSRLTRAVLHSCLRRRRRFHRLAAYPPRSSSSNAGFCCAF